MFRAIVMMVQVGAATALADAPTDRAPIAPLGPVVVELAARGDETRGTLGVSPTSSLPPLTGLIAANLISLSVNGSVIATVLPSGSMRPIFDDNALLVLEPAPYESLKIGDIVTYYHAGKKILVVHRILERRRAGFWTRGDHNSRMDDLYVTPENYRMRVFAIIYLRPEKLPPAGNGGAAVAPAPGVFPH